MDERFDSVFTSTAGSGSRRGRSSGPSWWPRSRAIIADHHNVRSVPGMTAARNVLGDTKGYVDAKASLNHSLYARDAREGFLRRAEDPFPHLQPAGACLPSQRTYPLKKQFLHRRS
uniref:Uncharacterized protein n=2 Tax=Alexandrium monilatum TaxID=311494 RepID=A0A7S4UBC8_9DINO